MNSLEKNNYIQYVNQRGFVKTRNVIFVDNGVTTTFDVGGINEDFFIFAVFQNNIQRFGIGFENFDNNDMLGFINTSVVDLSLVPDNAFLASEQVVKMSYNNVYVSQFNDAPVIFPAVQTVSVNNLPAVQTVSVNNLPAVQTVSVNNLPAVQTVSVDNLPYNQKVTVSNSEIKKVPVYLNPQYVLDSWGRMTTTTPTFTSGYVNDVIQNVFDCHSGSYTFSGLQYYDSVGGNYGVGYDGTVGDFKLDTVVFSRGGLYFKITETVALTQPNYVKLRIYQNVITNEIWLKINAPYVNGTLRQFDYNTMVLNANGFSIIDTPSGLKLEVSKIFF